MKLFQQEPSGFEAPVDFPSALRWVEGDHAILAELIEIFLEDCPQRLHELEQAVSEGNATRIMQTAHSLKGMVACFSAKLAQGLAAEMESLGKAGDLSKALGLLSTLQLEFARVMKYLTVTDWRGMN